MTPFLDEQQAARLRDVIARADKTGLTQYTAFLDPVAAQAFHRLAGAQGLETWSFGGYEDAERCLCAVGFEEPDQADYPLVCVRVSWDVRYGSVSHPDLLGAIMALGMERSRFGDIVMGSGEAYVFAGQAGARMIEQSLMQAGRANVRTEICDLPHIEKIPGKTVSATFQTLRLDAVVAEALRMPRSSAQTLISQGRVLLNYAQCFKPDARVAPPDIISVRGSGRIELIEIGGKSKKDRTYLTMEVFLRGRNG